MGRRARWLWCSRLVRTACSSRAAVAMRRQARRNSASAAGTRTAAVRIKVVPPIAARISVMIIGRDLLPGADANSISIVLDKATPSQVYSRALNEFNARNSIPANVSSSLLGQNGVSRFDTAYLESSSFRVAKSYQDLHHWLFFARKRCLFQVSPHTGAFRKSHPLRNYHHRMTWRMSEMNFVNDDDSDVSQPIRRPTSLQERSEELLEDLFRERRFTFHSEGLWQWANNGAMLQELGRGEMIRRG